MRVTLAARDIIVSIDGLRIVTSAGAPDVTLPDGWRITPGLIDLQVNGLREAFPLEDPSTLLDLDRALATRGVTSYLVAAPSRARDDVERLALAVDDFIRTPGGGCLGLHLEGPVLSPAHRGAHPLEFLRNGDDQDARALLALPNVRVITVAPEVAGAMDYARDAMARGIVVAAGHTGATAEHGHAAIDAGITLATHLFNAMTEVHQRAPGIAIAYLTDPRASVCFIADGVHLHDDVESLVIDAARDRCLLVSDAAPGAGHTAEEVLAGSVRTLADAVVRLSPRIGFDFAIQLASARPAQVIGETERGTVRAGARADLTIWDERAEVTGCVRGGEVAYANETLATLL